MQEYGAGMDIQPYQFFDAERVRFGRYPVLDTVLYRWARRIEETLFEEARVEVYAGASVVEEMKFSSYFATLNRPRPIYIFELEPFHGRGLFTVDNRFSNFCLRNGGNGDRTRLSQANQGQMQRVVQRLMDEFNVAWTGIHEVRAQLRKVTTYAFRARVLQPYERCLVAQIHLSGNDLSSRLTWCFPRTLFEPILGQLEGGKVIPAPTAEASPHARLSREAVLKHLRYDVTARMGQLPVRVVADGLQVGQVLPLFDAASQQAVLEVDGRPLLIAEMGQISGRMAARVNAQYEPERSGRGDSEAPFLPLSWPNAGLSS